VITRQTPSRISLDAVRLRIVLRTEERAISRAHVVLPPFDAFEQCSAVRKA
jgi:hypothetical protein